MKYTNYSIDTKKLVWLNRLIERHPLLKDCEQSIVAAEQIISRTFKAGNKLLVCGNGGSAADAEHISGELLKGFLKERPLSTELIIDLAREVKQHSMNYEWINRLQDSLPVIALTTNSIVATAIANDQGADLIFAQQILGYGLNNDALLCISTSGNSDNIIKAAAIAKVRGIKVIGLTGLNGGKLRTFCDVIINVPVQETYQIQELHLPIYHCLCAMVEEEFFGLVVDKNNKIY